MKPFESVLVENMGWMMRMARRYCPNKMDAEDLVGDTVFKLLRSSERFDQEQSFKPWALAVMQNTFVTQYNRRKRVLFSDLVDADGEVDPEATDSVARINQVISAIRDCARRSVCVECVILYAKGYTYEEISVIVGIGIGTVKSRISAGRKLIAEALDD